MKLGEMQVARSERVKVEARKFPTHASNRTGGPPKMALPVNRSKRGPETSRLVNVGKPKPLDKAVRRDLFYTTGSLLRGRTPK